jgi:hypothetical protein
MRRTSTTTGAGAQHYYLSFLHDDAGTGKVIPAHSLLETSPGATRNRPTNNNAVSLDNNITNYKNQEWWGIDITSSCVSVQEVCCSAGQ